MSLKPKRNVQVNIRLTKKEKYQLVRMANKFGFNGISDFVRFAVLRKLHWLEKWTT